MDWMTGLGLFVVTLLVVHRMLRHTSLPLPPGPPSYPIIGQILSMPSKLEQQVFHEMSQILGSDILSLSFFGMTIVVLNSAEAATDLLEKRANIYSNRLKPVMLSSPLLVDLRDSTGLMNPVERWKKHRRISHSRLNKQMIHVYHSPQQHQAKLLLQRMLDICDRLESSDDVDVEFDRAIASTIFDLVYGYTLKSAEDPFLIDQKTLTANLNKAVMPSNFLVNIFPALAHIPEWFPGAGWKKVAREWRNQKDHTIDGIYNWAKEQVTSDVDEHSIVASTLKDLRQSQYNREDADEFTKNLAETLYGGATDTTESSLLSFLLAMVLFPEVQTKAQQEIDSVIGSGRLPTAEDRPSLPYIEALILEVLRWQPVLPLAIPHVCAQDDEYRGYRIPKGAIVFGNIWSITRNECTYKDPEVFNPDRFLDPTVPPSPSFGWGRRICPGIHFAQATLFIMISSLLATFNISKSRDDDGNEIVPTVEGASGALIYHPKPFKCNLKPRSEAHADLIRNSQ